MFKTEKIVFSPSLAAELRNKGYQLLRKEANRRDPFKDVFVFKWEEGIEEALQSAIDLKKSRQLK